MNNKKFLYRDTKKKKILTGDFEGAETKGVHTISLCKATSDKAQSIQAQINENVKRREKVLYDRDVQIYKAIVAKKGAEFLKLINESAEEICNALWMEYNYLIELLNRDFKTQEFVVENITTTVGRSVLAQRLSNTTTYTGVVNYCAVGDDNTPEVVGDSTLGNETSRKSLSSGTYSSSTAYLETFFGATEAVDTHEEFGFFIDGTGATDSGQLFNRFTQTVVKSNIETMNVRSIITINDT